MQHWIQSAVTGLLLERPAQKLTLEEHAAHLSLSGDALADHLDAASGTPANRTQLRQIIGVERWGQNRLRAFLGDPLEIGGYDTYCPPADQSWDALKAAFRATREETVTLARELIRHGVDDKLTVPHTQYGKLTAYAWLRYLDTHANLEGKRIQ